MSMNVPNLKDAYDEPMKFECGGTYTGSKGASLSMWVYFDPRFANVSDQLKFDVQKIGIDQLIPSGSKDSPFQLRQGDGQPTLIKD
jgi:hypothetical protein